MRPSLEGLDGAAPGAGPDAPGRRQAFSYQVPRTLIESRIPGGLAEQSRATLPDGRALPPELTYDPNSQTFSINDTSRLPLPIDVRLTMPIRDGGQGAFVLTIGQP